MRQRRRAQRARSLDLSFSSGRHRSRTERERRTQRFLYIGAAALALLLVTLLLTGFYFSVYQPPRKTVAYVGEAPISLRDVADQARIIRGLTGTIDPSNAFNLLIRNEVLRQSSASLTVTLDPEAVDEQLAARFEPPSENGQPPTLTTEGRERFTSLLHRLRVSEKRFRAFEEGELLAQAVAEQFTSQVESPQQQVFVHWIVTASQSEAEAALQRIDNGEEFAVVASEVSTDQVYSDEAGVVGWLPAGAIRGLDELLFAEDPALEAVLGPVTTDLGVMIVRVTEGPSHEELSEPMRDRIGVTQSSQWLQSQLDALVRNVNYNQNDLSWVLNHLELR